MQLKFFLQYGIPLIIINVMVFFFFWFKKREYLVHFLVFVLFELVYILSNLANIYQATVYNHYPHLADALVHGRTYLDFKPIYHDYAVFNDKVYICHNPLPAVMMMPFVLIYGRQFNDIIFTILLGALNCALVYTMILRLNKGLQEFQFNRKFAFFMTLLFGAGTVHWYVAVRGSAWHTAQIVALFFLLLAVNETLGKRRYWLLGTFAALAIIARPSVFWAFPFFVTMGVKDFLLAKKYKEFIWKMIYYVLPYIALGILLGIWNFIRFGNPLDFGFNYLSHAPFLKNNLDLYGTLNLYYLPTNARIAFIMFLKKIPIFPYYVPPPDGIAIVFTSPFFLYFFAPLIFLGLKWLKKIEIKIHYNPETVIGAVLAAAATAIPLLLYFNTGWVQFGYRYILDYIPFLMILLAYCLRGKIKPVAIGFGILAFLMNLYGMLLYIHFDEIAFV